MENEDSPWCSGGEYCCWVGGCRADLSFCFSNDLSIAKWPCTVNQWEQEISLNVQEWGIWDLHILLGTLVLHLGEPKSPNAVEMVENQSGLVSCIVPNVTPGCRSRASLCWNDTALQAARSLKTNRYGLIGMRSPPRGWQKSLIRNTAFGVWDCRSRLCSFCWIFFSPRNFPPQLYYPFYFSLVEKR